MNLFDRTEFRRALGRVALCASVFTFMSPIVAATDAVKSTIDAPNPVEISPSLLTTGQPTPQALSALGALGIQAVIYLAPPTVEDAVRDEPERLQSQGIAYVNIPIQFNKPTDKDFDTFVETMGKFGGKKVLVHCQVNLRASSMVFLYRVIVGKEPPAKAYEAVSKVWSPNPVWKAFIQAQLKRHKIDYEVL